MCKGFADFSMDEAIEYLGLDSIDIPVVSLKILVVFNITYVTGSNIHLWNVQEDDQFIEAELDSEATEVLETLLCEIKRRIPIFGPLHESGESTNRGVFNLFENVTSLL